MGAETIERTIIDLELERAPEQRAPVVVEPNVPAAGPQDVIAAAIKGGATVEQLERILAMQIKWKEAEREQQRYDDQRAEEQRKLTAMLAYRRDFAAFTGENIVVPLTKDVDRGRGGSFRQSEFHVAKALLAPALSRHGFGFRHEQVYEFRVMPWGEGGADITVPWVNVTCYLEHRDGHFQVEKLHGPADEQGVNNLNQNNQSSASYLKRQSLLAITGTATGGEDDENRVRGKRDPELSDHEALAQQGRDQAMLGSKALTEWWAGLTPAARQPLMAEFGAMKKAAALADKPPRSAA